MMSFTGFLVAVGALLSSSTTSAMPLCNGFYQALPCYYRADPSSLGQRLMYVQYMAPAQGRVRAANDGVSTFVAADAIGPNSGVGAGAFVNEPPLKSEGQGYEPSFENQSIESDQSGGVKGAVSVAESYPAGNSGEDLPIQANFYPAPVPEEQPAYVEANTIPGEFETDRKGKGPTNLNDDTTNPGYDSGEHQEQEQTQQPYGITSQTVSPLAVSSPVPVGVSATYIPPRKKIRVELETPSEEESDEEHSYEEPLNTKIASRRPPPQQQRPPANSPPQKPQQQLPPGSYFATHFGSTSGGAIAIANSFSTGEGGSATSHATAYGSPAKGRNYSRKGV